MFYMHKQAALCMISHPEERFSGGSGRTVAGARQCCKHQQDTVEDGFDMAAQCGNRDGLHVERARRPNLPHSQDGLLQHCPWATTVRCMVIKGPFACAYAIVPAYVGRCWRRM